MNNISAEESGGSDSESIDDILDTDNVPSFLLYDGLEKDTELPKKKKRKRKRPTEELQSSEEKGESKSRGNEVESSEEEEESYEQRPRLKASSNVNWGNKEDVKRLPVKKTDGSLGYETSKPYTNSEKQESRVVSQRVKSEEKHAKDEPDKNGEEDADASVERQETKTEKGRRLKEEALLQYRSMSKQQKLARVEDLKVDIATFCQKLMSKPEASVHGTSDEPSKLRQMLEFCKDPDVMVRKLSILSLVAVFKDIIPEYRIRLPTAAERKTRLKKEVRLLWRFERELLEGYQSYLQILNQYVSSGEVSSLGSISIRCMCTMLVSKPKFNFRENLLKTVVLKLNSKVDATRNQCFSCIKTLLTNDPTSEITLEVITHISKLVKSNLKSSLAGIREEVITATFDCLLVADLKDEKRALEAKKVKKKRKRRRKREEEVATALEESEATVDPMLKHARQTESLRELFLMYLRVLKQAPKSMLLSPVLKGIAKYVHLINLDLVQALSQILTHHIKSGSLEMASLLKAIHTMITTLQGPGKELQVDESELVVGLYRLIHQLQFESNRDQYILDLIDCIEALFLRRVLQQNSRVTAFILQLAKLSLCCEPHSVLAISATVRALIHRYKTACDILFDSESDMVVGTLTNSSDPLLQDQAVTPIWALSQLQFHYHPYVSSFSKKTLAKAPLVPKERAFQIYKDYDPKDGGFNPPVQKPRRSEKRSNRKRDCLRTSTRESNLTEFDLNGHQECFTPSGSYFRQLLLQRL